MSNANIKLNIGYIKRFLKGEQYNGDVYLKVESKKVLQFVDELDENFTIYGCKVTDGSDSITMIWSNCKNNWDFKQGDVIKVIRPKQFLIDDEILLEVERHIIVPLELNNKGIIAGVKRKQVYSGDDDVDDKGNSTDEDDNSCTDGGQTPSARESENEIVPNTPPSKQPTVLSRQKRQMTRDWSITPLVELTTYKCQKIRVACSHEATVVKNNNNDGHHFNDLILMDDSGYVRCVAFNAVAKSIAKQFKHGHTYIIENFKYQTRVFKNTKYGEVIFEKDTRTTDITESDMLDFTYDFTPLNEVSSGIVVDIVAVIVRVEDTKEVKIDGKSWRERVIKVADECENYIEVKLYNNNTSNSSILPGTVIALKHGVVHTYAGVCYLKVSNQSYIQVKPEVNEYEALSKWYASRQGVFPEVLQMCEHLKMSEITDKFESCETSQLRFNCDGLISEIHTNPICYEACIDCKKKLNAIEGGRWFCQKCQKQKTNFVLNYKLTLIVEGDEHLFEMTAFNNAVMELFKSKTAQEMMKLKTDNPDTFNNIIEGIVGRKYHLICVASKEKSKKVQYRIESFSQSV